MNERQIGGKRASEVFRAKKDRLTSFVRNVEIVIKDVDIDAIERHAVTNDTKFKIDRGNFNIIRPSTTRRRVTAAKINHIRHGYTNYHEILAQLMRKSDPQKGYINDVIVPMLRDRVNAEICKKYNLEITVLNKKMKKKDGIRPLFRHDIENK